MKTNVHPAVVVALVVLLIVGIGLIYRLSESPGNSKSAAEADYFKTEKWMKDHGKDPRQGLIGNLYYKYHPEEKRPANLPAVSSPTLPGQPAAAAGTH